MIHPELQGILIDDYHRHSVAYKCCKTNFEENKIAFPNSIIISIFVVNNFNVMNYFSSDFKLGILGGGQLGKMLLFDTRKFDMKPMDPSDEAPCKIACDQFFKGDLMDFDTVYNSERKLMF
jgi:hypothetical protein